MERSPIESDGSFRSVALHTPVAAWHALADAGGSAGAADARRYSTSPSRSRDALYSKARACAARAARPRARASRGRIGSTALRQN